MNKNIYKFDPIKPFKTIKKVFEEVFGVKKPRERCGDFEPLSEFKGTEYEGYHIWFPKMKSDKKTGWDNKFADNGKEIISKNTKEGKALQKQINITFADEGKGYHYVGIFELVNRVNGIEHWRLKSENKQ